MVLFYCLHFLDIVFIGFLYLSLFLKLFVFGAFKLVSDPN